MHHPLHPMLITFPLGLWFTSILCDVIHTVNCQPIVKELAFVLLLAGCLGASKYCDYLRGLTGAIDCLTQNPSSNQINQGVAALPGMIDYLFIRDDPNVRGTATLHMLLNMVALAIFTADFMVRSKSPEHRTAGGLALSGVGGVVLSMSAWLGHSLVYRYGVAVEAAKKS